MIDKILEHNILKDLPKNTKVALLLSGGVDSTSLGFALSRLKIPFTAYTFHIKGDPTTDSTLAIENSNRLGWESLDVEVSTDNIKNDFLRLLKYGCKKKTQFENLFPMLQVFPKIKEEYVVTGLGADNYYGLTKITMINFRYPKSTFDKRRHGVFSNKKVNGTDIWQNIASLYHHKLIHPYISRQVYDYFLQFSWDTLHRPVQKFHVRTAYKVEFDKVKVRSHENMQLVAGIPKIFEDKILNSDLNFKKRIRTMDLCRDYVKLKNG